MSDDLIEWLDSLPPPTPAAYCADCCAPIFRRKGRAVRYVERLHDNEQREVCDPCHEVRFFFGAPRKRRFQVVA